MRRSKTASSFLMLSLLGCRSNSSARLTSGDMTSTPFKTVQISTQTSTSPCQAPCIESLAVLPGSIDEEAVGPNSFEIGDDGKVLISDPINGRLVVYQFPQSGDRGIYKSEARVALPSYIHDLSYSTTTLDVIGSSRQLSVPNSSLGIQDSALELEAEGASLISDYEATIQRSASADSKPLLVAIPQSEERLVSIQNLGTDHDGNTYCVLELAKASPKFTLRRVVRKYSKNGHVAAEITNVPSQGDISPKKEFSVRNGILYQMVVSATATTLNIWDLNIPK